MGIITLAVILLAMNCYFTWQIAIAPKQLKQFGDLYMVSNQELSEKLDEINSNLSDMLERLGGRVVEHLD